MPKVSYGKMPGAVSRFIVDFFLKNGDILLNDTNVRTVMQNGKRSNAYKNLVSQIHEEFGFETNEKQIRNHFDHIRAKVIAKGMAQKRGMSAEKRYRVKTGGGVNQSEEASFSKNEMCPFDTPQEEKLWSYFDKTPITVPYKEGESTVGKRRSSARENNYQEEPEPEMGDFESDSDLFEEDEEGTSGEGRISGSGRRSREDADSEIQDRVSGGGGGGGGNGERFYMQKGPGARAPHELRRGGGGHRSAEAEVYEGCAEQAAGGDELAVERGRTGGSTRRRRITERELIEEQFRLCEEQRRFFNEMIHTLHVFCDYVESQKARSANGQQRGLGGGGRAPANIMVDGNIEESVISSE